MTDWQPQDLVISRSYAGLTVTEMARRLGVPASTYRGWEAGKAPQGEGRVEELETWLDHCALKYREAPWSWRRDTHHCGPWFRNHSGRPECAVCGEEVEG